MDINTRMTPREMNDLNFRADAFNMKIKEENKGVVSKNSLEEADFLKLIITQLKTQDPTNPMDDKQFIGQMTQFTSMKQMSKMSDNMGVLAKEVGFTKALAMVNKNVTYSDANGNVNYGVVQSIKVKNGEAFLNIDGFEVPMSRLEEVGVSENPAQKAGMKGEPYKVLDENSPELAELETVER